MKLKLIPQWLVASCIVLAVPVLAQAESLRILSWGIYAPPALIKKFEAETGIEVKITLSNNEEMISKLRAGGGSGYDLVTPSQDRIYGPQRSHKIYRPLDWSKINTAAINPVFLDAAKKIASVDGVGYGVPFSWGTNGMVRNIELAKPIKNALDICSEQYKGRTTMRLRRTALISMAFSQGNDPFAAYNDKEKYNQIIQQAGKALSACKPLIKVYWNSGDELAALMRSGETVVGEAWDSIAIKLAMENPKFEYVMNDTGGLGWMDTYALPAKGKNDTAAYKWINFVLRPENAAVMAEYAGSFSTVSGSEKYLNAKLRAQLEKVYTPEAIKRIRWFPAIPPGLEEIEGRLLDTIAAQK